MIPCRYVLFAVFVLLPSIAMAESYICVSEMGHGFVFDQKLGQWKTIEMDEIEFILVPQTDADSKMWDLKQAGLVIGSCFDPFSDNTRFTCKGDLEIKVSKNNMQFAVIRTSGYWNGDIPGFEDGGEVFPALAIGYCALL